MPSTTEELGRLAGAIATLRKERAEAASARQRAARERHEHGNQILKSLTLQRLAMGRAQHREMMAARREREAMVAELMRACRRARALRHRERLQMSAAERARIAAFMGELTARVATLRQELAASREARAAAHRSASQALREELAEYRRDREGAHAAWCGGGEKRAARGRASPEPPAQMASANPAAAARAPFGASPPERRPRPHRAAGEPPSMPGEGAR